MAAKPQPKSAQTPESAEQPEQQSPAPKKRRKLLLISMLILVVVLAGGGGAGFYFMQPTRSDAAPPPPKPPVFVPLETFTVNLVSDPAEMQFMQAGITLKLAEKGAAELIKDRLPEVRNRVLMVLSGKRGGELLSVAGKQKLAGEVADAINKVIAPSPAVRAVAPQEAAASAGDASEAQAESTSTAKGSAKAKPVIEVLFTSFIIQ
jgi:flagellar FliL protein